MVDYSAETATRQQDDLDRLAARSHSVRRATAPSRTARSPWPWLFGVVLLALLLGMIASPWFERQVRSHLPTALQPEQTPEQRVARDPRVDALISRVERLEAQPQGVSGGLAGAAALDPVAPMAARIAALEAQAAAFQATDANIAARLEQLAIDLQRTSGAAEAGDRQVRDLFMVSVARRMVEAGRPLGPVLAALSARLSAQDAAAIDSLSVWSNVPQTRQTLAARLDAMAKRADMRPAKAETPGFFGRLMERLSGLITVRDASGDAPLVTDLLAAAQDALAGGDVALAAARLETLPPSSTRDQWLGDARALIAAEAALDRLEAMLLDAASADASALASAFVPPEPSDAAVPPPPPAGSTAP